MVRQIDNACKTLLEFGVLTVREALRQSDIDRCRAEVEHLHNLPSLLGEENLRRHLVYFTNDRRNYLEWIAQHRPDLQGHVRAFYALIRTAIEHESMTAIEARDRIRVHAGFAVDEARPGIVARLRPYTGVDDAVLADLVEALLLIHEGIVTRPLVDRDLCAALWCICLSSRTLASTVRSNKLADATTLDRLNCWIDAIETFSVRMMSGFDLAHCAFDIVELIGARSTRQSDRFTFLLPLTRSMLHDKDADVKETAEKALLVLSTKR